MEWLQHIPHELREFALSRDQALVRGGSSNILNIITNSFEDPDNRVYRPTRTVRDGIQWIYMSAQCGVLQTVHSLAYSYPSDCTLTDMGKRFLLILMAVFTNLKTLDMDKDLMVGEDVNSYLTKSEVITKLTFTRANPLDSERYAAKLLRKNETLKDVTYPGMHFTYNIVEDLELYASRRNHANSVPLSRDASMWKTWIRLRLYQNWLNTRQRLAATVFALERSDIPQPIAVIILKNAFGGESAGVCQLQINMGKVAARKRAYIEVEEVVACADASTDGDVTKCVQAAALEEDAEPPKHKVARIA
jgi:hypothetical protein